MGPGSEVKRLALVIGNGAYTLSPPLKNPRNDATLIGKKLVEIGFEVRTELDATADRMIRAIGDFTQALSEAADAGKHTAAVLFYAGHGVQVDGENYLLPVDAEIRTKLDLLHRAVGLQITLETLGSTTKTCVVLLDCCRDNPLPRTYGGGTRSTAQSHGLANVQAPPGVYIAFATQPHFVALDGTGDNSPFTEGLAQFIDDPGKQVSDVIMDVRRVVYEKTGGQQVPWDHSALFEPFRFVAGDVTKLEGLSDEQRQRVLTEEAEAREASYWQVVQNSKDVGFIHSFVTQFPNSKYRSAALARIDDLKARTQFRRSLRALSLLFVALVGAWFFALWEMTKSLPDTNIAMGDIVNSDGDTGFITTPLGCRMRCVLNRFDKSCVAFSYDRSTVTPEQEATKRRCFPKYAAEFYWNPTKTGTEAVDSEIMPSFFSAPPKPKESPYLMRWYRALAGDPIDVQDIVSSIDDVTVISDDKTGRRQVSLQGAQCQQACIDLGDKCKGFSYTSIANRCELFKTVRGVLRDHTNNRPVFMPATISGCDDPKAANDPETKQSECPARLFWLQQQAPVRSPASPAITPLATTPPVAPPAKAEAK
jgi:hypothetical protein